METTQQQPLKRHKIIWIVFIVFAIAVGNALAGWFIARGLYQIRLGDRYVSVKGFAERKVKADLATWNIDYTIMGDDLVQLTAQMAQNQKIITDFLAKNGFNANEIEMRRTEVVDQDARDNSNKPLHRYVINSGFILRTDKVDLVQRISQQTSDLIKQGIVLMNRDYLPNPSYFYTKLDEVRPQMLEQATKSARLVAEQFALNSSSNIGKIRHASQGLFQILSINSNAGQTYGSDTDQIGGIYKIVRVVISIDYMLCK